MLVFTISYLKKNLFAEFFIDGMFLSRFIFIETMSPFVGHQNANANNTSRIWILSLILSSLYGYAKLIMISGTSQDFQKQVKMLSKTQSIKSFKTYLKNWFMIYINNINYSYVYKFRLK